jgi:hypothetical protein
MTEDKLSGLFDEIRNESAQTSISEVDQWIDAAVATAATVGLLATLKLILIKKPLIMWTTLLTITGTASLGVVMIFTKPEIKEKPEKKEAISYSVPGKGPDSYRDKEEKIDEPVDAESPILEEPTRESNSKNPNLPENLGTLIPLKISKFDRLKGIPAYKRYQVTEPFTKIELSGVVNVELRQGGECSVRVVPESAADQIKVEIKDGTLYISNENEKKGPKENQEDVVIKVSIVKLESLDIGGATRLTSKNEIVVQDIHVEASGASDLKLDLKSTGLTADFSGASNVNITGTSDRANIDISGAADADLNGFSIKDARIDNSGAANLEITISESLKVDGSGASMTLYKVASGAENTRVSVETSGRAEVKEKVVKEK